MIIFRVSLACLSVLAFTACGTISPDVSFESSDGRWADTEISSKGRDFESIVWYFENYKLRAVAPEAKLYRTTEKPMFAFRSKWKVPYRRSASHINGGYYIDPKIERKVVRPGTMEEKKVIRLRVESHLKKLAEK